MAMFRHLTIVFVIFFCASFTSLAEPPTLKSMLSGETEQQDQAPTNATQVPPDEQVVVDEFNRGSPRSAMEGFLNATNRNDFELAGHYLDTRNLPHDVAAISAADLAKQLKQVLDRKLWVDLHALSQSNSGVSQDGLPNYRDLIGKIATSDRTVSIFMQRIPRGDGAYIWKISNASISHVPNLYQEYGDGPIGELLSPYLPSFQLLGMQSWQWVMVVAMLVGAYAGTWPLFWLAQRFFRKQHEHSDLIQHFISGPVRLLTIVLIVRSQFDVLRPSIESRAIAEGQTLLIVACTWVIVISLELLRQRTRRQLLAKHKDQAVLLLRPLFNVLKTLVVLFALLIWLENLGFQATTILAGLGIGGLAIALAAQKSVENIIGAITLYISTPVKAGDFCRFGDQTGIVEEIGLRFTRVRTLDRTVINIPNATFVDLHLENFAEREKIRFNPALKLRLDNKASDIERVLLDIKQALTEHAMIDYDPVRVRLQSFTNHGLELNILCYVKTTDFNVYLEVAEALNLTILRILEENQVTPVDQGQYRLVNPAS
ncbi:mechanosensitive ion channel family protein [Neiella marina]|uniref:Mechanosensitive ion channel family protein n=1 Tax=Neiella holothuriorum TaxID=2870530 RepID=A0ABS7EG07_9GAMM|nr:mechanosensitive ion channel family protein [Neiella holothuriorum]MBW8191205.1 mechanosensitive ion channel family protein [Neiella holothuriorum]